jgi:myo-inositol 2-dehydrogenase / D-chiro-inositol 1-dehydrogenase
MSADTIERRQFLKTAAAAAGASVLGFPRLVRGAEEVLAIRVGLVGCGRRGLGAALNVLSAAPNVTLVAVADLFADQVTSAREKLRGKGVEIAEARCFSGWSAYETVIALPEVNYVILATPPHFRPMHMAAAVEAGKHVYIEKPAGVDAPGVLSIQQSGEKAKAKGLAVGVGLQRRHWWPYQETVKRLQQGVIGDIVAARCYWNTGGMWRREREAGWSDMEWQIRNWLYFSWLSGDHIVEQHVHNIDVINWLTNSHPVRASGMGGRQVRTGPEFGNIYDHFNVEFEYADGMRLHSECRQIDGCSGNVSEAVVGTRGTSNCADRYTLRDGTFWRYQVQAPSPFVQVHADLIASIRAGNPANAAAALAESTLTAIMGRLAAYSGQTVTWEEVLNSKALSCPGAYEFGPVPLDEVPMPGRFKVA